MKIYYLGTKPVDFPFELDWRKWGGGPIYEFDALVIFEGNSDLSNADQDKALLAQAHGRPVLYFGPEDSAAKYRPSLSYPAFDPGQVSTYEERLGQLPRTNYRAIDCNFYDNFEAAIVQRRPVRLVFLQADGSEQRAETRLLDTKTHLTEEYVQFRDGTWLRLDRIKSVDGIAAGSSCSF
ncbi:hypothetical protein [Lewinella sp. 4G2]|uniref:hypothetical protein n=1 Tax=Lewinella sp. 4G2 TaxID=1803372 RepID=UPI0007B4EB90|nr:hypothetical protein [Lewinella sp. 4G2]OAV45724.1 hypothetical protein A3850_015025 [Lewinella sp. 4G2]